MANEKITIGTELVRVKDVGPARREPLVPERIDVFDGDQPVEEKVSAFLARLIPATEEGANTPAGALVHGSATCSCPNTRYEATVATWPISRSTCEETSAWTRST